MENNTIPLPGASSEVQWHDNPSKPIPQHVLQMVVVDEQCRMLMFKRTGRTDSACDVWSMPSGRHEIGESVAQTLARELFEEFGLHGNSYTLLGQYENIAGDDPSKKQYHWVITVFLVIVKDLEKLENKEPEKHSDVTFMHYRSLLDEDFFEKFPCHPTLETFLDFNSEYIVPLVDNRLNDLGI